VGVDASAHSGCKQVLDSRMKRLFAKITGGWMRGLCFSQGRKSSAQVQPPVSFSPELEDAIESAIVSVRAASGDGDVQRIMVQCHALGRPFIFEQGGAVGRIRKAFPDLAEEGVTRGVRLLEKRVRRACKLAARASARPSWVTEWMDGR